MPSGAHDHPEIGPLETNVAQHEQWLGNLETRLSILEQTETPPPQPPPEPPPPDPEKPEWQVGYGAGVEHPGESYNLADGDVDSLHDIARSGGVEAILPPGGVFRGSMDRFEHLWVTSNTWINCPTLDAHLLDMPIHTEEGSHVTGNVVLRGFAIEHPNIRETLADGIQIAHSPVDNVIVANVTIHQVADEQIVVWGKKEKGGSPRRMTFYKVLHTGPYPLHPANTQRSSHGLLVGYQKSWRPDGTGFFSGDMKDTHITAWECMYMTGSRQPVIGSLGTYHSVHCIRRHWTGYSAAARYSGRLKSTGDVWDARTPNGKELETVVIHQDRFGGRGPEDSVLEVTGARWLNGAGPSPNYDYGGSIPVPYEYPEGKMSDAEIQQVIATVGSRT